MKNQLLHIPATLCLGFVASCSIFAPTPIPEPDPKPTKAMAIKSNYTLEDLQTGYQIYNKTCFNCHNQPDTMTYELVDWLAVVDTMGRHAGLSKSDTSFVGKYIHARSLTTETTLVE